MALDYAKAAQEVLEKVGGADNVASAAHCATRLRLVIADNSKVDKEGLENVEGVKGVFEAQGQTQIIFGTGTVNKVYEEFLRAGGISEASKEEAKQAAAAQQNIVMRGIKLLGDVFVPIIPAIVASGLLLGIMSTLNFMIKQEIISISTENPIWIVADIVSSTAFGFLQVLIGFSAAKAFGANPYLGAVVGALMISSAMPSAYDMAADAEAGTLSTLSIFGLYDINWYGYQGHVVPIVIACAILAFLEKRLHKVVPEAIDLFVTPLVSVFVTAFVVLLAIGPIFVILENWVLWAVQWLITLPLGIGAFIVGGFYAPTVVTGLHQMYTAIDLGQLAQYGVTYWLPIASAANIGQAGATLAVALKTKDAKVKGLAVPSALSAFMGITEPAIFGVNLRYIQVFIAGCIGGAVGALICSLTGLCASGTGVTGIFGILLCMAMPLQYIIMFFAAACVAFAIAFVTYKDPEAKQLEVSAALEEAEVGGDITYPENAPTVSHEVLSTPVGGTVVPAAEIADPTFAAEVLGPTVAVEPDEGVVVAPADGLVATVFDTGHAVGIVTDSGCELLIHIGIDTVQMGGDGFTTHVKVGQRVKAGDPLVEVDFDKVRAAGHPATTMTIVSNGYDFDVEKINHEGDISLGANVFDITRKDAE